MTDKAWKKAERRSAKFFLTRRTPLSGGNSQHETTSDSLHAKLYIEVKQGRSWNKVHQLVKETVEKAKVEGKIPIVCLHPKSCGELFIIRRKDVKVLEFSDGQKYEAKP